MNKKITFLSDYFYNDFPGGGEANNEELIKILIEKGFNVTKINTNKCFESTVEDSDSFFIIANFIYLSELVKEVLQEKNYIIIEHDHKYLFSRNPANYPDYLVPEKDIINKDFYKNAIKVYCQSSFHKDIVFKNLKLNNIENLSGNLWSDEILTYINNLNEWYPKESKKEIYSIMDSEIIHKNTNGSIEYCKKNNFNYELIKFCAYATFLTKIAQNKYFVFFPQTPETLSRILVECRMLNVETITKENCGAIHESWYSLQGEEMINFIKNKKIEIVNKIMESIK